jgi:hypothetical protein
MWYLINPRAVVTVGYRQRRRFQFQLQFWGGLRRWIEVGFVGNLRGMLEGVHYCLGGLRCGKRIGQSGGIWVSLEILLTSL